MAAVAKASYRGITCRARKSWKRIVRAMRYSALRPEIPVARCRRKRRKDSSRLTCTRLKTPGRAAGMKCSRA
eukprot:7273436-Prymnesium_polylepis.1